MQGAVRHTLQLRRKHVLRAQALGRLFAALFLVRTHIHSVDERVRRANLRLCRTCTGCRPPVEVLDLVRKWDGYHPHARHSWPQRHEHWRGSLSRGVASDGHEILLTERVHKRLQRLVPMAMWRLRLRNHTFCPAAEQVPWDIGLCDASKQLQHLGLDPKLQSLAVCTAHWHEILAETVTAHVPLWRHIVVRGRLQVEPALGRDRLCRIRERSVI